MRELHIYKNRLDQFLNAPTSHEAWTSKGVVYDYELGYCVKSNECVRLIDKWGNKKSAIINKGLLNDR